MHAEPLAKRKRRTAAQPVTLLHVDDAQLKIETIEVLTGRCRRNVYHLLKEKKFPEPVRREGSRSVRWRAQDVRAWLQSEGAPA
ncbi:MAG: AlpA family phage regulatory protein [Burkholderiales bacterium]|nr:AlpA family phage regulatory protein [Burkholderiales bacterium]